MSDNKVGSLVWEASLDAEPFLKGEKATVDAQQRIIDKAEQASKAQKAFFKTQQESIDDLNAALNGTADTQEKSTQKTASARRAEIADAKLGLAEAKQDRDTDLAERRAAQAEIKQAAVLENQAVREDRMERQFAHRQERDRDRDARREDREAHYERMTHIRDFGAAALGVFGIVTGVRSVISAYGNLTDQDAARGRMARRTGVSAGGINALENAQQLFDKNPGAADGTIESLAGTIRQIKTYGTAATIPAFNRLGINLMRNGRFRSPDELIDAAHTAVQGKDRDVSRELLTQAGYDQGTIDLIMSPEYARLRAQGRANSNVTDKSAADAQSRQEAAVNKEQNQTEAFRSAVDYFGGYVKLFDDAVSKISGYAKDHPILTAAVGGGAAVAGSAASGLMLARATGLFRRGGKAALDAAVQAGEVSGEVAETVAASGAMRMLPLVGAAASLLIPTPIVNEDQNTKNTANSYIDYLTKKGWSRSAAAGMVANIYAESSFNPEAAQPDGAGRGLAQWTDANRKARIEAYLGKPITQAGAQEQLDAIDWEARQFYGPLFQKAQSVDAASAGDMLSRGYEAPAKADSAAKYRSMLANRFYGGNTSHATTTVHIKSINVHTPAIDPQSHGQKISQIIRQNTTLAQASYGLA